MNLHILDVKQYMYAGQSKPLVISRGVVEDQGEYRPREMMCGSLAYLFDEIIRIIEDKDNFVALCFDSPPTVKRELSEEIGYTYKKGRAKAPVHVTYQYEVAKDILPELGFNCMIQEGLEADDLISSLCFRYNKAFQRIIIHTNDSDQYYLVKDRVECVAVTKRSKSVNRSNYEMAVHKSRAVPYNTLTLEKLFTGESSDNVPPIITEDSIRLSSVLGKEVYPYLGDNIKLRAIVKNVMSKDSTLKIFDLIAPILTMGSATRLNMSKKTNMGVFNFLAFEFGCHRYQRMSIPYNKLGDELIDEAIDKVIERWEINGK